MEIRKSYGTTLFNTNQVPSNPPPQRQAILRSLSGRLAADPDRHAFSPLLARGGLHTGRLICMPVLMF